MIQPLDDCSRSMRRSSKYPVFHSELKSRSSAGLIVNVARLGKHARANGICRDPAIAVDHDLRNHVLLRQACSSKEDKSE